MKDDDIFIGVKKNIFISISSFVFSLSIQLHVCNLQQLWPNLVMENIMRTIV